MCISFARGTLLTGQAWGRAERILFLLTREQGDVSKGLLFHAPSGRVSSVC